MKYVEIKKLENYLKQKFNSNKIEARKRQQTEDSCEIYIKNEFVGIIYKDDEEGIENLSYIFEMPILAEDLKNSKIDE